MILFLGIPSEPPMRLAIESAQRLGVDHVMLNQRHMDSSDLIVELSGTAVGGRLVHDGRRHALESFTGIYVRVMDVATLPDFAPGRRLGTAGVLRRQRAHGMQAALLDWLELADCRIASRPSAMTSNISKPYQAQLIESCRLATPVTLVTNDPDEVRRFAAEHGSVVFKSISGVRSIVRRLDTRTLSRLDRIRSLPTQFQAHVPGVDVRVHVAGDEVHAAEIRSEAVDYRYAGRDGVGAEALPHALPDEIADRCRAVSRALALPLCGLDLRRTPDGRYVCFEANPMPAYAYYQEATGQPISDSLIRYLAAGQELENGLGRRELVADRGNGQARPAGSRAA